jgi:biotin operon repressor
MNQQAIDRLQLKNPAEAIIERVQHDFNLAPLVARTLFDQMRSYFESYYHLKNDTGQLTYLAVSIDSPAGRKLTECQRVAIKLSLHTPDDLVALKRGVAALRQARIMRLTEEAYEQGALLSHEDLACLLSSSLATIKRDVGQLRQQGLNVPTRGQVKDIGKGVSHKTQIVQDYLAGYTFSEIERRRRHSAGAIGRYCQDFVRVVRLRQKKLTVADIRRTTGLSERLITEYLALYDEGDPDNDRLHLLLAEPHPATAKPAEIKRGSLIR